MATKETKDMKCIECGETHPPCRCGNPTKCDPTDNHEPFILCDVCDAAEEDSRLDPLLATIKVNWTCEACKLANPTYDGIATTYDSLDELLCLIRDSGWPICTECGEELIHEVTP